MIHFPSKWINKRGKWVHAVRKAIQLSQEWVIGNWKMTQDSFPLTLFAFLRELEDRKIHFELGRHRDEAVMVKVAVPGQRWEVEFCEDGTIDGEVFRSAEMLGSEGLRRLLDEDDEAEATSSRVEPRREGP